MPNFCPFCQIESSAVRHCNEAALAFRDLYPLSPGHTLVIPRAHRTSIYDGPADEQSAVWRLVAEVRAALLAEFGPCDFTIGVNDGVAAGQTIGHAHVHVIPRFPGDVPDPRGGIRWIIPRLAAYWEVGK